MAIFNNCAFVTLTYARSSSIRDAWLNINGHCNRYLQRCRRKLGNCEYLRAYEQHKDGYPHAHLFLIFRDTKNIRDRGKFLQDRYYRTLKSEWTHGLSDAQSPKYQNHGVIGYILKYMSKSTSSTTLWSKILGNYAIQEPKVNDLGYPLKPPPGENVWKYVMIKDSEDLLQCTWSWKRIKLLMWSRGFVTEYKRILSET